MTHWYLFRFIFIFSPYCYFNSTITLSDYMNMYLPCWNFIFVNIWKSACKCHLWLSRLFFANKTSNNIFYRSIYGNFGIALSSRTSVQLSKLCISVIQISIWFKMLWNLQHRSHLFYSYHQSIYQLRLDHKQMIILTRCPIFQVTSGTSRYAGLVVQVIAPGHTPEPDYNFDRNNKKYSSGEASRVKSHINRQHWCEAFVEQILTSSKQAAKSSLVGAFSSSMPSSRLRSTSLGSSIIIVNLTCNKPKGVGQSRNNLTFKLPHRDS